MNRTYKRGHAYRNYTVGEEMSLAMEAYQSWCINEGVEYNQPCSARSQQLDCERSVIVTLSNVTGDLAVYRVAEGLGTSEIDTLQMLWPDCCPPEELETIA